MADSQQAFGAAPSGYSEYYIPGDEESMDFILDEISPFDTLGGGGPDYLDIMHCIISVTAWSDNTTLYYDHWEDGYDFDPTDVSTADETYVFGTAGANRTFESAYIPAAPRNPANIYYDGGDRLYVAGGTVTVTRTSWNDTNPTDYPGHTIHSTLLAVSWEIYPVRPQLIKYILPFGEDLALTPANGGQNLQDFDRVFALVQATEDNTVLQIDFNKDGTFDNLDWDRDGTVDGNSTTLQKGEVFLLDRLSIGDQAITYAGAIPDATTDGSTADNLVVAGTEILGSETLQVHYVIGDEGSTYEIRGLTAFPRGLWDNEYYAPVDGPATPAGPVDLYLYNPQTTTLSISYETTTGGGTFTIPAQSTRSFNDATGGYMPQDTGVYFNADGVFWGVSTIDTEDTGYDWAYALVPASLLRNEHFVGWAPGSYPVGAAPGTSDPDTDSASDSGIYLTPARDNTTIFVDYDGDGYRTADGDVSYTLDRLESQYVYDATDGDMSNANIYATGPYSAAYGQNPDTASPYSPAIDVGYTTIPGVDFIDLVLTVDKTASPAVIPTASGSSTTFTLTVQSHDYSVTGISVEDTLPANWDYDNTIDTTTITLADNTTVTTDPVETVNADGDEVLTWNSSVLGSMAPNQEITIVFTAHTTTAFSIGDLSRNDVKAVGTRTVQTVTQTFTTTDFTLVGYQNTANDFTVSKTSSATDPVSPGDAFTYTVSMTNTGTGALTGISIYDPVPDGVSYVASSSQVSAPGNPIRATEYYIPAGSFTGTTYDLTLDQDLADDYFVIIRGAASGATTRGPDDNYAALTADPNATGDLAASGAADVISLTRGGSDGDWVGVVTVVECLGDQAGSGFQLLDVQRVAHPAGGTTGTDTSATAWTDINQVMLMGGFYGAGCDTTEANSGNHTTCFARIYPSGTNTINWTRQAGGGSTLAAATSTVMALEWGADWTVQRVNVTGTNGGNGLNATGEYNTAAISSVARANTWVWGTGHTDDNGIGDGGEGVIVTLGDGVNQNVNETTVAVGTEYGGTGIDYEVYALTHASIAVDYRFKTDGNPGLTYNQTVDSAADATARMALVYNGCNGTGNAYPRPILSARYTANTTVELERQYSGQAYPAWTQGIDFSGITGSVTQPGNNPPNFVGSGDGYSLAAGESLTLTFDVTVDDPLGTGITEITNTADVLTTQIPIPKSDSVTNIVNNPSSGTGEVGDLVWLDTDGDGFKDPTESGLANVEVTLKDEFGTSKAVTATDGNGWYRFTGITPGTGYYVEVTGGLPSGLVQSAPTGHSDDRTDAFDLTAGQVYLDADLGYTNATGTGSIGDFVWNDDDGDGIQDSGELGLSGVTVALYFDADNDGVFEPGGDDGSAAATTVTGPDGTYLFNNVSAADGSGTDDYFVFVDATQAALSGYDYTTSPVTRVIDLADGEVNLTNDFGFENTSGSTYTYSDRVWFDADDGGDLDSGETGISGVTVNLLDASRQVVATVTTDANGEFSFSGLVGSTFYYVEISDTAGKLTDYYGTTAEAIDGELQISNLTGDVDNRTTPSFGYNAKGAVGDTVFNDVDGDGVQDAGELGISGIAVKLYNDDDGDGVIDAGVDTVQATLTTDANGNYMFSSLADGNYIVSIESPPGGFSFTGTDSDGSVTGDQLSVSITGGGSDMTVDFGYQSADNRSVSGTLWNDTDGEGDFDETVYMENVTVALYQDTNNNGALDAGEPVQATVTTGADGTYSFAGLPAGRYIVVVTDENGELTGYETTYEVSGTPFDGQEGVNLTSGNASAIDFGYYNPPVVTRAVIGDFGAYNEGGKVVVRWQTVSEHGTVGFYLYRLDENAGKYKAVNKKLLPGLLFAPAGGWYSYEDKSAKTGAYYTYRLEEVEVSGKRLTYGPWKVFTGTPVSGMDAVIPLDSNSAITGFRQGKRPLSDKVLARMQAKMESRLTALAAKMARKGIQAKISVTEDGIYFIDANDIATTLNIPLQKATQWIKSNRVRLRSMGQKIAVWPAEDNSGLYFYGERRETRYSDENIYWLDINKALTMNEVKRAPKKPVEDSQYFYQWVWEEESQYPMTGLFFDPGADFWMWDYVFPGYGRDQVTFPVSLPGIVDVDAVTLTVSLQGGSEAFDGNDHHAMIRVNGQTVGEAIWDGLDAAVVSVSVSPDILIDGENQLEVTGMPLEGVPYNIFYVNNFQFVYPRQYIAENNFLIAENKGYKTLRLDGFTDSDILVFDITDSRRPKVLAGTVIEPSETGIGGFQVRFKAGGDFGRYLAMTPDHIKPCTLIADQPSFLEKRFNLGDYVIITSSDMVAAAQTLADYRTAQGHVSQVVDIEDIYDEFSYGIRDPEAIRNFLAYAYSKWRIPPKYVLLAGDGSFDYKDFLGFGEAVVPALIAGTPEGLRVTDFPYANVAGDDRIPEFAVGRIPVISADELRDYIDKVMGYELSGGAWTSRAILAADEPDSGGDFIASSEEVAALFPVDFILDRLYLDTLPIAEGRLNLVNGINDGRAYVNFIGHGTMFQIGNHNLFSTSDLSKLNNGTMLPVFTAMTCIAGDFGYPGFDGLSEELVMKSDGGAVAMWAPSGYAYNDQSLALCNGFYNAVFIGGETIIGDAIRRSFESYATSGEDLYHLDLYNLIGDPALVLK